MGRYDATCKICNKNQKFIFEYHKYVYCRCVNCGLVSTYPLPDDITIETHYAKKFIEGNYQLLREYSDQYIFIYKGFVNVLESELRKHGLKLPGLSVLDVGCFTGEFLYLLRERGADVYGLELQTEAVEIANEKLSGRVLKADVYENIFPKKQFDIITLLGVVEHVLDPAKLLNRSSELLKPGGILLIQTPNSASLFAKIMGKLWPPFAPVEHIHIFTKKSIKLKLKELGFENISFNMHIKKLPVSYVFTMLQNFGPEFYRIFKPIYKCLPKYITDISLPFFIGEMIVKAHKKS
ncbi:MAG: class I SAM-dependent methyltransferase [Elusimicrobia bacterium]|nr:class I SAM-dependent methyltransferase [Elusimicrobiota bacterium]